MYKHLFLSLSILGLVLGLFAGEFDHEYIRGGRDKLAMDGGWPHNGVEKRECNCVVMYGFVHSILREI